MTNSSASLDARRKQLLYRANHRGIKEMDILLGGYAAEMLGELADDALADFEALLDETDRDLLTWITGEKPAPERVRTPVFDEILVRQQARLA